jgi:hypothetical protein
MAGWRPLPQRLRRRFENAPAKPSTSNARSRLPASVVGQRRSRAVRRSAVAGYLARRRRRSRNGDAVPTLPTEPLDARSKAAA